MNEQDVKQAAEAVLPKVNELAQRLLGYLESGMDLAQEQAPLLVAEILRWAIFEGMFFAALFALPALVWCGVVICRLKGHCKTDDAFDFWMPTGMMGGLGMPFAIGLSVSNLFVAMKAILAPRVFLIEYLSDLL
ncbi:MAG: hypothetical protein KAJ19_25455 [Gammaproteobacteria bacterium]|nr:hypothetical protein [Gammaproteobacteria bacterium]